MLPLLALAAPAEGKRRGLLRMRALLHIQVPHVVLIGGPGLQRLEQTLVAGVLLGELQAALHALDPCQQLEQQESVGKPSLHNGLQRPMHIKSITDKVKLVRTLHTVSFSALSSSISLSFD